MKAEDFFCFFPEADIIFLEGQKYSDYPKLEVLRKEISEIPVCRPGDSAGLCMERGGGLEPGKQLCRRQPAEYKMSRAHSRPEGPYPGNRD